MRILLVTGDQPIEQGLMQLLERSGHELTHLSTGGSDMLSSVEEGTRFHAAVLNQGVLGRGWPRQIRDLRRQAPYLPAVVLLAADGEHAWRHAILAGAFEALPLDGSLDAILEALSRALRYSAGKALQEPPRSPYGTLGAPSRAEVMASIPVGARGPSELSGRVP
jgi:DNA-binding NtrC family response regulator